MADQVTKGVRGRPKSDDGKTGAERQALYAKARARAEVAHALKDILLRTKASDRRKLGVRAPEGYFGVCSLT